MFGFLFAVVFALGTAFWCSLLEALVLSTTTAEVEALKRAKPVRGVLLERFREHREETISSIRTLNTMAHTPAPRRRAEQDLMHSRCETPSSNFPENRQT